MVLESEGGRERGREGEREGMEVEEREKEARWKEGERKKMLVYGYILFHISCTL